MWCILISSLLTSTHRVLRCLIMQHRAASSRTSEINFWSDSFRVVLFADPLQAGEACAVTFIWGNSWPEDGGTWMEFDGNGNPLRSRPSISTWFVGSMVGMPMRVSARSGSVSLLGCTVVWMDVTNDGLFSSSSVGIGSYVHWCGRKRSEWKWYVVAWQMVHDGLWANKTCHLLGCLEQLFIRYQFLGRAFCKLSPDDVITLSTLSSCVGETREEKVVKSKTWITCISLSPLSPLRPLSSHPRRKSCCP